jgi:hypothetical protein
MLSTLVCLQVLTNMGKQKDDSAADRDQLRAATNLLGQVQQHPGWLLFLPACSEGCLQSLLVQLCG